MGADKIVEEEKKRDEVVGGIERSESLLGFVPGFELLVKAFDEVVRVSSRKLWTRICLTPSTAFTGTL